jgi:hypothetical protein
VALYSSRLCSSEMLGTFTCVFARRAHGVVGLVDLDVEVHADVSRAGICSAGSGSLSWFIVMLVALSPDAIQAIDVVVMDHLSRLVSVDLVLVALIVAGDTSTAIRILLADPRSKVLIAIVVDPVISCIPSCEIEALAAVLRRYAASVVRSTTVNFVVLLPSTAHDLP